MGPGGGDQRGLDPGTGPLGLGLLAGAALVRLLEAGGGRGRCRSTGTRRPSSPHLTIRARLGGGTARASVAAWPRSVCDRWCARSRTPWRDGLLLAVFDRRAVPHLTRNPGHVPPVGPGRVWSWRRSPGVGARFEEPAALMRCRRLGVGAGLSAARPGPIPPGSASPGRRRSRGCSLPWRRFTGGPDLGLPLTLASYRAPAKGFNQLQRVLSGGTAPQINYLGWGTAVGHGGGRPLRPSPPLGHGCSSSWPSCPCGCRSAPTSSTARVSAGRAGCRGAWWARLPVLEGDPAGSTGTSSFPSSSPPSWRWDMDAKF